MNCNNLLFEMVFKSNTLWFSHKTISSVRFGSVQSLSHVRLFANPWIAARQASLSITNSRSSLRVASIKSVMPSSHLILGRPLLLMNFALIGKKGDYSAIQHHNNLFQSLCSKTTCNCIIFKMIYNRAEKKRPHGVKHMTSLLLIGDRIHFFW